MSEQSNVKPEADNMPAAEEKEYICSNQCPTCKCQKKDSIL